MISVKITDYGQHKDLGIPFALLTFLCEQIDINTVVKCGVNAWHKGDLYIILNTP